MNKLITKYFYFILLSGSSLLYSQNYSLSFDGNDQYVNLGYSANFDLNDATISIWFKSDWNTPDPDWTGLFGRHDNWAFAMQYNYDTQNTRLSFSTGPSIGVSDNVFTPDEIPINDGRWHHALVTRNASSGTFKLYFDGVFIMDNEDVNNNWEAPSSVLAGTVTSNYPLLIGKHHPGHNRTASGFVDDIAIWNKELNDAQIQQLFNQESPTSIDYSNLTGYWNFESGSGSTVYDQTIYQNNGEIINSASWSDDAPVSSQNPSSVTFIKEADADYSLPENQDRITENIWITRGSSGWLYNAKVEDYNNDESPAGVLWAFGSTSSHDSGTNYDYLKSTVTANLGDDEDYYGGYYGYGGGFSSLEGETLSMYIAEIDQYYDVTFNTWGIGDEGNGGAVSYTRVPVEAPGDENPSSVTFIKEADADYSLPENQDRITENIWITRGSSGWLYNAKVEDYNNDESPAGVLWAFGSTSSHDSGTNYDYLKSTVTANLGDDEDYYGGYYGYGGGFSSLEGETLSMYIAEIDQYYDVTFNTWGIGDEGNGGAVSYTRVPVEAPGDEDQSPNYSLSFDGEDDYASIPGSEYFDNLGDFSFSIWIRLEEDFSLNSSNQFIINKDHHPTYGNASFSLRIQNGGDGLPDGVVSLAWLFDPVGNNDGLINDLALHTDINNLLDNQWHYISCTRKESTGELKLYVDGNIVDSGVTLSGAISTPNQFIVGSHVFTDRSFFKGKVDDFNFWSLTLSQQEILSNMNTPLVGDEEGLVGYWNFNDGEGSTLTDLSGNGNDGTIYGATWSDDVPPAPQEPSDDINYSVHFDFMSGYAESPLSATETFGGLQPFTVEAWYKNQGVDSGNNSGYDDGANIVSTYRRSGGGDPNNNFNFGIHTNSSGDLGKAYADHGTKTIERIDNGTWHHIAATYEPNEDGSWSYKIYHNGLLNSEVTSPAENYDHTGSNNKIRLNNHSPFAGDHMLDCSYAGISISTGAKYIENFSPEFPLNANENTILNLDFSTGEGSQLSDNSGNENHFNLYGNYQWETSVPVLPVYGCTDSYASNFNSDANADDGSCDYLEDGNNYSLDFGGDVDYVELSATDNFDFSDEQQLTISAYVKALGNNEVIFQAEESFGYYIGTHNEGGFALTMYFDGYEDLCVSSTDITDGNWHHVVGAYDGSSIKIYVDGELENTCDAGVLVSQDQSSLITIGAYRAGESNYQWNGSIDELNIWNASLSDDDVVGLLSADTIISSDNLIANYKFNSGSGDILFDHSGNANHGQINEATWADGFRMPSSQVTFLVNMREFAEDDVLSEGVYISGGNIGSLAGSIDDQTGFQMFDDDGDHVFEVTLNLDRNSFYSYKFRIGLTDGNWQGNWEGIPQDCGYGEWFDRSLNTSSAGSQIVGPYCFGSCDNCDVPDMSLSFDGVDDFVQTEIQNDQIIENNEITVSSWIYLDDNSENFGRYILSNYPTSLSFGVVGTESDALHNHLNIAIVPEGGNLTHYQLNAFPLSLNQWTHVAVTINTNNIKWYLNGEHVETEDLNISNLSQESTLTDLVIGRGGSFSGGQYWSGNLDNIGIWSRALSYNEVEELFLGGSNHYEDLVSFWDFNDGEGSTLTDYSGNGNHGSIYGATWNDDFPVPPHAGPEWFVDEDGSDDNNGSYDYPFSTIQHAINSANDGDSIFVSSGTYYENINFYGKEVKVFGLNGPEETIIDGQAMNSAVVAFRDFDYSDAGIYGFTIQNAEYGVMVLNGGSPEIKWCIVRDITLGGDGGFYLAGDGIGSSPTVSECLIYGNESNSGEGGGIRVASNNGSSSALIINCTIVGNSPEGIRVHGSNTVVDVVNTIIYDNPTSITNLGTINITNSNVQGGFDGDGNFDDDPQFCNPGVGDYLLSESSSSLFYVEDSLSVGFYNDPGCENAYMNYALNFDGIDDYVNVENNELLNFSSGNSYSIQLFFKTNFSGQLSSASCLMAKAFGGPTIGWQIFITPEPGNPLLFNANQSFQNGGSYLYGPVSDEYNDGEWHNVTIVYDHVADEAKFYFDGSLYSSYSNHGGMDLSNSGDLKIGADRDNNSYFKGSIDEVSIWGLALTEGEISDYYKAFNGSENGLLAHFNLNAGDGNTLLDVTGNGNDGTINGALWVNGAPVNAPEPPEPEITAVNVEIDNNNVSFSFEADTSGLGFFDVQWVLGSDTVMSYQGNSAQDLRPGLHYVRAGLIDQSGELRGDEVLQSFYILNGYEQYYYTDFEDTVDTGLPAGWGSYSNGQGWYVSDDPYFEYWTTEPGVGSVAISNDDAADNDGENDFNDGSQDYLYLPPLDFTSFSTPVALEFGSFFTGQWSQTAHVTYTTDGGSSWQTLADIEPSWKWERQYFDLSFLQGYENVSISFHSNDNNDWGSGLIIDDVSIIENYTLPTSFITGYVYSSNGDNPLIGASIIAVEENNYFDHQTISDSTGYYSLELISGTNYYLNTSLSDYQDNVQYVSVSDDSLYLNIYLDDFQEVQDAIVEGHVINWYTNESVPNASVLFVYSDDEMQTIELSTDESGYFMAQVPSQKDYDLFVYADGYWVEHDAFYLNENEHQVLSVSIAEMSNASRLYGTIRDDETNELIPYAEVYLNCDQASDWDRTGQLGTYRLFNYYTGDCDNGVLVVNAQGYETSLQSVSDIEFEIGASINKDISLSQGNNPDPGMLSGTIISNIDDNQIHGAILKAFSINSGLLYETSTDSGYFSFTLPESEYTVSINADGHQEKLESIYIHSGSQLDTVIYLDEIYSNIFYGLVSDTDGNLIDGAMITAHFEVDNISSEISTISNTDGSYQLIVPDGTFDLAVSRTGYQISWVYDVSILESNIEQDFTLDQIGSFDGALMGSVYFFGNLSGTATINIWNDTYFAEAVTAENGTFYIDLINGTYSIFAAANGYTSVVIPDAITIQDNVVNYDIHFSQPGFVEPPVISSLSDVPNDQGRKLDMSWLPGDPQDFENFTQYSIWRKITSLPTGSPELWHYIATEDYVQGSDIYERSVPTLIDANPDTVNQSTFMVTAHTEDPFVFFDSPPFSGFSVDNLFPEVPSNISVSSSMADNSMYEVLLSWSEAADEDFAFYNVYRSDINSDESAIVFQVVESIFTDVVSDWGNYEYWVTAVDHNGNESEPSEIAGIQLSVEEELIPDEFALSQNYPNPFNPSTQIRYALAENTKVTVTIYNMLGSKVRTLVNNYQDAGFKNVLWNATNDNGASVSAGMYIYTIQAGNFYQAKKMILLK